MSISRGTVDVYDTEDMEVGTIVLYQYATSKGRGGWSFFFLCRDTPEGEINVGHFATLPEARAAFNEQIALLNEETT